MRIVARRACEAWPVASAAVAASTIGRGLRHRDDDAGQDRKSCPACGGEPGRLGTDERRVIGGRVVEVMQRISPPR
jgi:hypothetical protein